MYTQSSCIRATRSVTDSGIGFGLSQTTTARTTQAELVDDGDAVPLG